MHTRFRFLRHLYQLLLKYSRKEVLTGTVNISLIVEEILKSIHVCREALNSSLQTIALGAGYGTSLVS